MGAGPLVRGEETESFAFHSSGLDSTVTSPLQSHSFLPVWTTSFSNLCLLLTGSHAGVGTCMLLSYFYVFHKQHILGMRDGPSFTRLYYFYRGFKFGF